MSKAGWALDRWDGLIHCYLVRNGAAIGYSLCRRSECGADAILSRDRHIVAGRAYCTSCVVGYQNAEKTARSATTGGWWHCERCGGSMYAEQDRFGQYRYCLQCGCHVDSLTGPPIELCGEHGRQRNPRLRNNTVL